MIVLVQGDGPDAGAAVGFQGDEGQALHHTLSRGHHQELVVVEFPGNHHGGDGLAGLQGQHIDHGSAPGGAAGLGNLVALAVVDLADVGEEENVVVGGGDVDGLDVVLLLQVLGIHAPAAPALGAVGIHGHPLHVALVTQGEGADLLLNQILDVDFVLDLLDFGFPLVAELVPDFDQLVTEHATHFPFVCQQLLVVGDLLLQLLVFGLQLLPVQALEGNEPHIADGLGLDIIQAEPLHQALLGVVVGGADDVDDLVDVVLGNEQALQQVGPLLGLAQIVLGAPGEHVHLMGQVLVQNLPQ